MKMLMIIFKESLEEEVQGVLTRHHVKAFTEMHDVTGVGEGGATLGIPCLAGLQHHDPCRAAGAGGGQGRRRAEGLPRGPGTEQGNAEIPLRVFTLPCELVV